MIVSSIAAIGKNKVIGVAGGLPWHLPLEFKHFKEKTLGHHIVMGRKNFESIGRPLPKRPTIIVTRNKNYKVDGCTVVHSIEESLAFAKSQGEEEVFICGGADIYALSLPFQHRFYRTIVDTEKPGDVYYPDYESYDWQIVETRSMEVNDNNSLAWKYDLLEKIPDRYTN